MTKAKSRVDYHSYIGSDAWRSRHREWLRLSDNRCSAFPWVRLGSVKSRYHRYEMHHAHYKTLGHEVLVRDVIPLCPFAHSQIVHGILSGWKRPKQQKHYPNAAQKIFHGYCRIAIFVRQTLWLWLGVASGVLLLRLVD